jgi:hypothetical protein
MILHLTLTEDDDPSPHAHYEWLTFASVWPDGLFFCNHILEEDLLLSLLYFFFQSPSSCFCKRARRTSSRFFPGMLMFRWIFLFPVKGIWRKSDIRGQDNTVVVVWGRRNECWIGPCGSVPLVVGGSSSILEHDTEIQTKNWWCCAKILLGSSSSSVWMLSRNKFVFWNP